MAARAKKALPRYQLMETSGAAHEQRFEVACEIDSPRYAPSAMAPAGVWPNKTLPSRP
jgi:dsRNA-specific ribonuclease